VALQLYNTLTRRKEPFVPGEPGRVRMYDCGPTVYSYTHIGHLRPALVADVLARYLRSLGFEVAHITNFTDVDDRIIQRANEEGVTPDTVANRYIADYLDCMRRLGITTVERYVRVTEHIPDIVAMIERLVANGHAYPLDGDVYYDVTSKADYGKLAGRSLDEMLAGARVAVDERKRHPMDFALWKGAKPGEPAWPSPWGPGRPGWHIECSAMSLRYLGDGFDIHAGGDDLIFPHHENEIAQSEAFTGHAPFVRYWVHNGMLQIDQTKMSKSLGNFIRLHELLDRFPAPAVRLFMLTTQYRKPMNYSEAAIAEAERGWARLRQAREHLRQALGAPAPKRAPVAVEEERVDAEDPHAGSAGERGRLVPAGALREAVAACQAAFTAAMDDDLNTAGALGAVFDLVRAINTELAGARAREVLAEAEAALDGMLDVLGLRDAPPAADRDDRLVDGLMALVLDLREEARSYRDWAAADRIRARLAAMGVTVEDTSDGPRWQVDKGVAAPGA
jgi:cysteinyl-tRNA synthetase